MVLHMQHYGAPFLCCIYDLANVMMKNTIAKAIATSINERLLFNSRNLILNFLNSMSCFSELQF